MVRKLRVAAVVAVALLWPGVLQAQAVDPHAVFEQRCSRCHTDHASDFTRRALILDPDGRPAGRESQRPVVELLANHPGAANEQEILALEQMFMLQLQTGGLYQDKCRICHSSAKRLARVRLDVKNGTLVDRVTRRNIEEFLKDHGRLDGEQSGIITRMLTWQVQTAVR